MDLVRPRLEKPFQHRILFTGLFFPQGLRQQGEPSWPSGTPVWRPAFRRAMRNAAGRQSPLVHQRAISRERSSRRSYRCEMVRMSAPMSEAAIKQATAVSGVAHLARTGIQIARKVTAPQPPNTQ